MPSAFVTCRYGPILASAIIGCVNIGAGSRSRGGICLAVALYLLAGLLGRRQGHNFSAMKAGQVAIAIAGIALSLGAITWLYQYASGSGLLGQSAKQEYEEQSAGDYGVLLGGRSAILGSLPAIYDSPLLGHGSWARDPLYVLAQVEAMAALGYENISAIESEELQEGYVPAHSFIFGAWVEAGILGAIFWGWVLVLVVKTLLHAYPGQGRLLPLVAFCGISLGWDLVFSPYGAEGRIIVPYYVVLLMTFLVKPTVAMASDDAGNRVMSQALAVSTG